MRAHSFHRGLKAPLWIPARTGCPGPGGMSLSSSPPSIGFTVPQAGVLVYSCDLSATKLLCTPTTQAGFSGGSHLIGSPSQNFHPAAVSMLSALLAAHSTAQSSAVAAPDSTCTPERLFWHPMPAATMQGLIFHHLRQHAAHFAAKSCSASFHDPDHRRRDFTCPPL